MTQRLRITGASLVVVAALVIIWQLGVFKKNPASKDGADAGVPVRISQAQLHDAPIYISSIATVQAFNSVLVRARVDGEISRIAFREGEKVKRGEILVELDRRPFEAQLRAAVAQREKDQAVLDNTKQDLARYVFLSESDSVPTQTLDTAKSLVHQLGATIKLDDAQIDSARLQVAYATIRAPIDGRTGARLVDTGNMVHANDTNGLVALTQTDPIAVTFALPQKILSILREQQAQRPLQVEALSQDTSQVLGEGELTLIDNQIDVTTGTIHCKAVFKNAQETLWPGQFVIARVLLKNLVSSVSIPTTAVQTGAQGSYVFVVKDNVAQIRPINVGPSTDNDTIIFAGLASGENVVLEGQYQLEPNARVKVITNGAAEHSKP